MNTVLYSQMAMLEGLLHLCDLCVKSCSGRFTSFQMNFLGIEFLNARQKPHIYLSLARAVPRVC